MQAIVQVRWPLTFAVLMATTLLLGLAAPAGMELPDRLTDEAFWKRIIDSSEGTVLPTELEPLPSNEPDLQSVIPALRQHARPEGVYLGTGLEQNFTYIAAIRPRVVFIINERRQRLLEHLIIKAVFEMSDNRAEYVSRLLSRKRPPRVNAKSTLEALLGGYLAAPVDERAFAKNLQEIRQRLREKHRFGLTPDDLRAIERIYAAFRDRGPNMSEVALAASANKPAIQRSYLANEDSYSFIRDLQIRNMIVPVTGEISGDRTVRAVGRYLQEHALTVTAFYLSDVEWKAIEKGRNSDRGVVGLYENVGALPLDSTSMLIRFGNGVSRLASIQKTLMGLQSGLIQTYGDLLRVPAPESLFIAPDNGINAPIVLQHVNPPYSEKARVNKTTGTVRLEITVRSDGIVEDVVVRRSLGDGLDESAIQAIQQWRFSPATRDGVRVSVRVQVEMHFKLI